MLKRYLAKKHCTLCNVRLDRLKKVNFNQVTNDALVQTINQCYSLNKTIKSGDMVCKKCISACKRNKKNVCYGTEHSQVLNCSLDHSENFEELFDELVTKDSSSSDEFNESEVDEIKSLPKKSELIELDLNRSYTSHKKCFVCRRGTSKGQA